MKISGSSHLGAPPGTVWRALNDPAVLVRTLPGCRRLEALDGDTYAMTLAAGVGAVKGVYDGQVRLSDQDEPGSFRMHARGAGAAGTVTADVLVTLAEADDGGTSLSYEADATVGGMVGGVGQRMLVGVSRRMAGEFFANVERLLQTQPAGLPQGDSADTAPPDRSPVGSPVGSPGRVYTSAEAEGDVKGRTFVRGVLLGAATSLLGALVGAWITRRGGRQG